MKKTQLLDTSATGLETAADLLADGALVAFPTETVYGLGGDARNPQAVARIFEAKGRPSFNPLIVHVPNMAAAERIAVFDDTARALADAFWPGPFTMVLPLAPDHGIASLVTAELDTVAVRVPAHPVAQALLAAFGGPLAAPSANPSGQISPTTAAHVLSGLGGRIAAIVDGGACAVGLESTIVGGAPLALLRPGGVPVAGIEAITGPLAPPDAQITAPGQLASHYAPQGHVRLNATQAREGEVMLGFGLMECDVNLSETADLAQAAARLFDALHVLDATGRDIAVAPIPEHGLGQAINDRLRRAAAPR
ncbi:L-threonylcarbamoyladenylate synthase [uncultured Tateyamaria sp.]|uniref:L-threonylcarbamoyladenylate synthase n=1 Tax=Tateyamaria sp. 1078 TaxID=3417464 RepID=UPI002611BCD3|nr:L-threonylcarbamoyladenylate synthase [uncultured Tateyamaria sp.]